MDYLKDFIINSIPNLNLSLFTIILFILFIVFAIRSIRIFLKSIIVGIVSAVFAFLLNAYLDYGWTGTELLKNMTVFALLGIALYVMYEKIILLYKGTKIIYKIMSIPLRLCHMIGDFIISTILFIIIKPFRLLFSSSQKYNNRPKNNNNIVHKRYRPKKNHILNRLKKKRTKHQNEYATI